MNFLNETPPKAFSRFEPANFSFRQKKNIRYPGLSQKHENTLLLALCPVCTIYHTHLQQFNCLSLTKNKYKFKHYFCLFRIISIFRINSIETCSVEKELKFLAKNSDSLFFIRLCSISSEIFEKQL